MVRWFLYTPASNAFNSYVLPREQRDRVLQVNFSGEPAARALGRLSVEPLETDDPARDGDFPCLMDYGAMPLVRARAWEALQPLVGPRVQALPVGHPRGLHFLLNVLDQYDCLDQEESELQYNEATGRVSRVWHYVLRTEILPPRTHMFKTPAESGGDLFVDDAFKAVVEEHGLRGLRFRPLP